jgi:hypothetical protein
VIKLKILITGVGITGKSTLRRKLKRMLSIRGLVVEDIDGDYQRMPKEFKDGSLYLIEDVHALMVNEACLPLYYYDLIIYLLPNILSHSTFWLKRILKWFQIGQGSWDKKRQGWLGTGKRYDPRNIPLFLRLMIRDLLNRGKWIEEDTRVLSLVKNRVIVVKSSFSGGEIKFSFTRKF